MRGKIDSSFLFGRIEHFFALGAGLGLAPRAPGTFGTLGGYPLALFCLWPYPALAWPLLIFSFIAGCYFCDVAGKALGVPDHGAIVWDEIVSFAAILVIIPADALHWILAFVAFRFFDILKPWPIRYFDSRFKNGFGVMFDDVLAAIYAAAVILLGDTLFA